jgi:hypothetical protein
MKVDPTSLMTKAFSPDLYQSWTPMIDNGIKDSFIPQSPEKMLKNKNAIAKGVDAVILGHNTEEGLFNMAPFIRNAGLYANFTANLPAMLFGKTSAEETTELDKQIVAVLKRYNIIYCITCMSSLAGRNNTTTSLRTAGRGLYINTFRLYFLFGSRAGAERQKVLQYTVNTIYET